MITKDMPIEKVLRAHPKVIEVLARYNMGCLGCMGAQAESIENGARAHGIDVDALLTDLNALLVGDAEK